MVDRRSARDTNVPAVATVIDVRLLLVVNSSASSVTARAKVVIAKALAADHDVTVAETNRRGHATRLSQGAARDGLDAVVVLGGDGTLNEAANGLAGTSCALGVLPGGSTNVFARTIGMTNDPIEATGELLQAMANEPRRIGLGNIDGRYVVFHAGFGFDAAVVERVERHGELKRWAGHPMFMAAAARTWMSYDRKRPAFRVRLGDEEITGFFALVMNTNPYTFLGNRALDVAPKASLDSKLTVVIFQSVSLPVIAAAGLAALRGHGVEKSRKIVVRNDVDRVDVVADRPFPYQLDGDYLGEIAQVGMAYEPDVLGLYVP